MSDDDIDLTDDAAWAREILNAHPVHPLAEGAWKTAADRHAATNSNKRAKKRSSSTSRNAASADE